LTVWSGWWWLKTTSVTSPGATPRSASAASSASRDETKPGSTITATSPSVISVTVLPTRSPRSSSRA